MTDDTMIPDTTPPEQTLGRKALTDFEFSPSSRSVLDHLGVRTLGELIEYSSRQLFDAANQVLAEAEVERAMTEMKELVADTGATLARNNPLRISVRDERPPRPDIDVSLEEQELTDLECRCCFLRGMEQDPDPFRTGRRRPSRMDYDGWDVSVQLTSVPEDGDLDVDFIVGPHEVDADVWKGDWGVFAEARELQVPGYKFIFCDVELGLRVIVKARHDDADAELPDDVADAMRNIALSLAPLT